MKTKKKLLLVLLQILTEVTLLRLSALLLLLLKTMGFHGMMIWRFMRIVKGHGTCKKKQK